MAEVMAECTYVPHHLKKIVLVLSAMRHFAKRCGDRGVRVRYVRLDDPDNTQTLRGEVQRAVAELQPRRVVVTEPGEHRVVADMRDWARGLEIRSDTRFVCSIADFRHWAGRRNGLRMEFFYRDMRRRTGLLMTPDSEPEGGRWNFDAENRKRLPAPLRSAGSARLSARSASPRTSSTWSAAASPAASANSTALLFRSPPTGADAALADFIANRLPGFGDWQDAMRTGDAGAVPRRDLARAEHRPAGSTWRSVRRCEAAYRRGACAR